ncbi:MAG: CehA/McbA family metallohydrolase [Chloroflexota bacterium]|nr:CehA/McbA family metallohydrolase [Anaerolineae bacterium]
MTSRQLLVEIQNPYETTGEWYKGNVHTHSLNSDGSASPQEVCVLYAQEGYDFLAITDHDVLTDILPEVDIIHLPGEELSTPSPCGHMVALNIQVPVDLNISDQDRIKAVNAQGGIPILAHPNIHTTADYGDPSPPDHGWSDETIAILQEFQGIEIYNLITDLYYPSGYSLDKWDAALSRGQRCWGFAVDDAHVLEHGDYPKGWLGGWIVVRTTQRARGQLVSAIRSGSFYSSTGIEIREIQLVNDTVTVETADADEIRFIGQNGIILKRIAGGAGTYRIRGNELYVRVECVNSLGKYAWSQPFYPSGTMV